MFYFLWYCLLNERWVFKNQHLIFISVLGVPAYPGSCAAAFRIPRGPSSVLNADMFKAAGLIVLLWKKKVIYMLFSCWLFMLSNFSVCFVFEFVICTELFRTLVTGNSVIAAQCLEDQVHLISTGLYKRLSCCTEVHYCIVKQFECCIEIECLHFVCHWLFHLIIIPSVFETSTCRLNVKIWILQVHDRKLNKINFVKNLQIRSVLI